MLVDLTKNIVGDWSWFGDSTADWSDASKTIEISPSGFLQIIEKSGGENFIACSADLDKITFGSDTLNQTFFFDGTGLTTFGGNILVNGGFIGDTDDASLIEIDGALGFVTVDGNLGIGISASATSKLVIAFTQTLAQDSDCVSGTLSVEPLANNTNKYTGYVGGVIVTGDGGDLTGTLIGVEGNASIPIFSAKTYGNLNAVLGSATGKLLTGGHIDNLIAVKAEVVITNAGGTITNAIGLCVDDIPTGATNSYAIKTGVGLNSFGDVVKSESGRIKNDTLIDNTNSPYTVLNSDHEIFVDTDTAAVTVNLPAGVAGTNYRIINAGSSGNDVTVTPNGAELLTGVNASRTLSDGSVIIITYESTKGWW